MKITNNIKKILGNLLYAAVSSLLINFIIPAPELKGVWTVLILAVLFFSLATFYGDKDFNITENWSCRAKNAKDIIGTIFGIILLAAGFEFCYLMLRGLIR